MKVDLTTAISVVVALCAIVSPVITTIINNRYQLKLKKMEREQYSYENTVLHERDIFEEYLKHAGRCIYYADSESQKDYGEHYFVALPLAPDSLRSKMIKANALMLQNEFWKANAIIEEITPEIRELTRLR